MDVGTTGKRGLAASHTFPGGVALLAPGCSTVAPRTVRGRALVSEETQLAALETELFQGPGGVAGGTAEKETKALDFYPEAASIEKKQGALFIISISAAIVGFF